MNCPYQKLINEKKGKFLNFIKKSYPKADSQAIIAEIDKYIRA